MSNLPVEVIDEPKIGTASWMIPPTVNEVFPYTEGAVWLGRNGDDARSPVGRKDESHVLLCAMNRSAKGRAIITNNLLLWQGSLFCNDPKGENASVTAARRGQGSEYATKYLNQKVCVLDSHHTAKVDDRYRAYYNVLDELDHEHHSTPAKAENIVSSFVTDTAKKDETWDDMAIGYMKALILHIVTAPVSKQENDGFIPAEERDLVTFRRMIQTGHFYAETALKARIPPEDLRKNPPDTQLLLLKEMERNPAFDGIIADEAKNQINNLKTQPKLWNSIRASAALATKWIDDPQIRKVLRAGTYPNTFRAEELETDPKGVSLYVCLKLEDQKRLAAWPRMITNMVLSAAQTEYFRSPASGHNTLMMLDEFAALQRMKTIEDAAPAIAGAGVKLFLVLQNLSQMKSVYGENFEAFMANAGTHIYYGFNDNFTAEYVKKRLGEIEVIRKMRSSSTAIGGGGSTSNVIGGGTQEGTSKGNATGRTRGWSPALFHLSLFTSKQKNKSTQSGTSSGTNENWSRTVQEQHSETSTDGWTQQLHKKPLADINDLMQLFGTIDDENEPNFPGIGLISTAEKAPALVQKCLYDQDRLFEGMFDPHPKHGFTALEIENDAFDKMAMQNFSSCKFFFPKSNGEGDGKIYFLKGLGDTSEDGWQRGPTAATLRLLFSDGSGAYIRFPANGPFSCVVSDFECEIRFKNGITSERYRQLINAYEAALKLFEEYKAVAFDIEIIGEEEARLLGWGKPFLASTLIELKQAIFNKSHISKIDQKMSELLRKRDGIYSSIEKIDENLQDSSSR